ncbi:hypothetical protein E0198_002426 [Clavispora lusitaniae]|nr:hypothetical protein E0198_002426 [Clavispora lusitaniae]
MSLAVPAEDASLASDTPLSPSSFGATPDQLSQLHDPKSLGALYKMGGLQGLADKLATNTEGGLPAEEDNTERVEAFGANRLPIKAAKSFFQLCFEAMKDKVLILLTVAAVISLALGLYETFGQGTVYDDEHKPMPKVDWVEGVAIIVAVLIVVLVGAANDYQKERQFARLNAKKEDREVVVLLGGDKRMISIYDLLVGDVICLETGDVVPADSVLITGEVECDESALTGESETIKKRPAEQAMRIFHQYLDTIPQDTQAGDLGDTGLSIKLQDPFLISGARVLAGVGTAVVTAVGTNSIHGRTMASLNHEAEVTPLQARLDSLAEGISRYGFLAALVLFVVLLIRFGINLRPGGSLSHETGAEKGKKFVDILIVAVTIVVVAVPEGLPLAVTLALAFATTRMAQNGNLVRVLRSCETMGGATAVCSDKTGTLTENVMRIVRGFVSPQLLFNDQVDAVDTPKSAQFVEELPEDLRVYITSNIVLNSTAFENPDYDAAQAARARQKPQQRSLIYHLLHNDQEKRQKEQQQLGVVSEPYLGNKTESALLLLAQNQFGQFDKETLAAQRARGNEEIVQVIPFESSRKWAGIVMRIEGGFRLYVKGAAEIVSKNCGFHIQDGKVERLDRSSRDAVLNKIDEYANDALRAIMLAHRDFAGETSWPPSSLADPKNPAQAKPELLVDVAASFPAGGAALTMDFLVGIQDPLKEGVPEAVAQCKMAGVTVRMVTGDNLVTAKAISRGCNILTPEDSSHVHACMEGPAFRALSDEERRAIVPELRVLARSSPEDKRILVQTLRAAGEVVAVTGDGTNDAPALKLADVGFSMGISGTEVAREASDIILMTDDFTDIVQAIKWGRTVAESIKKFIQFQLTVNITACVLTFVSAVASSSGHSVLTAVQLLWVNLIMDTLAALALATDKPDDALLNRKPAGRTAPLISVSMWKMILGQSMNQLIITFVLHFAGHQIFFGGRAISNHENKQLDAMTFNTFVWLQFWKLFVTRKLDECADVRTIRGRINAENLNFFAHLFRNWYFVVIALLIGSMQVLIMFVGGAAFTVARQTPAMWATAIIGGTLSLPVGALIRIVPNHWAVRIFPTRAFNTFIYFAGFHFLSKKNRAARAERDLEKASEPESETETNESAAKEIK